MLLNVPNRAVHYWWVFRRKVKGKHPWSCHQDPKIEYLNPRLVCRRHSLLCAIFQCRRLASCSSIRHELSALLFFSSGPSRSVICFTTFNQFCLAWILPFYHVDKRVARLLMSSRFRQTSSCSQLRTTVQALSWRAALHNTCSSSSDLCSPNFTLWPQYASFRQSKEASILWSNHEEQGS